MSVAAVYLTVILMTSCNEKLTYCHFDDTVIEPGEITKDYHVIPGTKGIYVLRGKYQIFGKVGEPGMLLGYNGIYEFDLSEFLAQHPKLASPEITKLAEKQKKRLKHVSGLRGIIRSRLAGAGNPNKNPSTDSERTEHPLQLGQ